MRTRLAAVRGRPGWIGTQLLIPNDGLHRRVIIGTWQTRADWVAWHNDPAFVETHTRLDGLEGAPRQEAWHEVVLDVRASELDGLRGVVDTARDRLASALMSTAEWLRGTGRGGA